MSGSVNNAPFPPTWWSHPFHPRTNHRRLFFEHIVSFAAVSPSTWQIPWFVEYGMKPTPVVIAADPWITSLSANLVVIRFIPAPTIAVHLLRTNMGRLISPSNLVVIRIKFPCITIIPVSLALCKLFRCGFQCDQSSVWSVLDFSFCEKWTLRWFPTQPSTAMKSCFCRYQNG